MGVGATSGSWGTYCRRRTLPPSRHEHRGHAIHPVIMLHSLHCSIDPCTLARVRSTLEEFPRDVEARGTSRRCLPPRATWASVVPKPFEKFSWKMWPPARFSMPKLTRDARIVAGDPRRASTNRKRVRSARMRAPRPMMTVSLSSTVLGWPRLVLLTQTARRRRARSPISRESRRPSRVNNCRGSCWCLRRCTRRRCRSGSRRAACITSYCPKTGSSCRTCDGCRSARRGTCRSDTRGR